jgi:hypothetical protein
MRFVEKLLAVESFCLASLSCEGSAEDLGYLSLA